MFQMNQMNKVINSKKDTKKDIREYFVDLYPKRTQVNELFSDYNDSNINSKRGMKSPSIPQSQTEHSKTKKIMTILLIAIFGAVMYSANAYTQSDHIFGTMGFELFDQEFGDPGFIVMGIHTFIFSLIIWIILKATGLM